MAQAAQARPEISGRGCRALVLEIPYVCDGRLTMLLRHGGPRASGMEQVRNAAVAWSSRVSPLGGEINVRLDQCHMWSQVRHRSVTLDLSASNRKIRRRKLEPTKQPTRATE